MDKQDRFIEVTAHEIDAYIEKSKSKNTVQATNTWFQTYKTWAGLRNVIVDIETVEPGELDKILQRFFAEIKKQNGKDYEPSSLACMQAAIDRYLKEKNYPVSILKDREFAASRKVLEGKARTLRENGLGKKPNRSNSLSLADENILWQCGQMGMSSPYAIINSLWWLLTQHFGLRGRQEHHDMMLEHFTFKEDGDGCKYITFAEGITKTRQSGLHLKQRLVVPKMFETKDPQRCPVTIFNLYISKRPLELREKGPFYLSPITNPSSNIWFKSTQMGINTINRLMKQMIANSPISDTSKKITNHSARKTVVKKLKHNQFAKSDIITITGHNNERGLDPYDSGDEAQQKQMSLSIDNYRANSIVKPDDPRILKPTFEFFSTEQVSTTRSDSPTFKNFNFNNCTVNFGSSTSSTDRKRKRRVIFSSSDED